MAAPRAPAVAPSAAPSPLTSRQVEREFRRRLEAGEKLRPAGAARRAPLRLLARGYTPKHKIELFDATYYLTNPRQNEDLRFFVAYVVLGHGPCGIFPRIFYKDVSLVWRSASHYARSRYENWIGKGDVKRVVEDGEERLESDEATTDLPLEIQTALETLCRRARRIPRDDAAVGLVLRRGPDDRIEPFRDFTAPRRRAAADRRKLVHGGRPIARFRRRNDPTSLVFAAGFEPDFEGGMLERSESTSRLYGGRLRRFRIASRNRRVQYLFFAGPRQVWIGACQSTGPELTSYGVRALDVVADEALVMPGFEYHFIDDLVDPPVLVSQIPEGFVGKASEHDPARADASPWLDRMPVIREFRRAVLGQGRRRRRGRR